MAPPLPPHVDTPQHATFPFLPPSATATPSTTSSPSLLLTTITCPISPPVPNRRDRQRKNSSSLPYTALAEIALTPTAAATNLTFALEEIALTPTRPAPSPPNKRTKKTVHRPMHMVIPLKQPEAAGLWTVWEDKRGEAEAGLDDKFTMTSEDEELVGLGVGLKGWDKNTSSRFSTPSPRGSCTSLFSITDSLPTSVTSDAEDDVELVRKRESDGLFFKPMRKDSEIEDDEAWEFAYALEGPRTPLKSDFASDFSRSQLPCRTTSPARRPPPLDLRSSTTRKSTRLPLPSIVSPLTPTLRTAATNHTVVTPPLSVTSSSHSSFASLSPLTPSTANRDEAGRLIHAFASFLMSCEEDPLEFIDAQDTSSRDDMDDVFVLNFPSPPRRPTASRNARDVSSRSPRVSTRKGGGRSRSPSDDQMRSTTFATPPRRSMSDAPTAPLPPVPSVPEQYRKRAASTPVGTPECIHSPSPQRPPELRSCKALQTVTGLLDDPSSPLARSIPLLESQAALQDSPFSEQAPLAAESRLKSFLPCPELLPSSQSGRSSFDSSLSSHSSRSSQRSTRRALPPRASLPEQWLRS